MRHESGSKALLFFLAARNLLDRPLTTSFLVAAIATGTGFQIPVAANLLGYRQECLKEAIVIGEGDVRIRSASARTIEEVSRVASEIARRPEVLAVTPVLTFAGAVGRKGKFHGVAVNGIDGGAARPPYRMVRGEQIRPGDAHGILVGSELAEILQVKPGDEIQLRVVLSLDSDLLGEDTTGRYSMVIRGITGGVFYGYKTVFVDRAFLATEAGMPNQATSIYVHTRSHNSAPATAAALRKSLPEAFVRSWTDDSAYLKSAIGAIEAISTVTTGMVIIAVAIPVLALLYISVLARRRDIALLMGIGFTRGEVFTVFLFQTLCVGFLGLGVGALLAYGLMGWFQVHPLFAWQGFVVRPIASLQSSLPPAAAVLGAALLAGVYPALRAARLDPAIILRSTD